MFGIPDAGNKTQRDNLGRLRQVQLVVRDRAVWDLLWDFMVIKEMAEKLPVDGVHQGPAMTVANEIINVGDAG